jgi:hypothetical protein
MQLDKRIADIACALLRRLKLPRSGDARWAAAALVLSSTPSAVQRLIQLLQLLLPYQLASRACPRFK